MDIREISRVFSEHKLPMGRMISASKSGYMERHKGNDILFNANIYTKLGEKIWYGDLDITKDCCILQEVCNELNVHLYIVREMLGRFSDNMKSADELERDAHAHFMPKCDEYLSRIYEGFHPVTIDNFNMVTPKGVGWKKIKVE